MTGQLHFRLVWTEKVGRASVDTLADLSLLMGDLPVWPLQGDPKAVMDCFADEVLTFLADGWRPLLLEEAAPLPVSFARPSDLRREAARRWSRMPEAQVEREDEALWQFEETHNLARAFGGQSDVPPLWFLRQGRWMTIETTASLRRVSLDAFIEAASELGDEIAARLETRQPDEWKALISAWRARDVGDPVDLETIATSLDGETVKSLIAAKLLTPANSVTGAANDDSELRAAARMIGGLPPPQVRRVLEMAKALPVTPAPRLEELSAALKERLADFIDRKPHVQGALGAAIAREQLGYGSDIHVDPFEVLGRLGVPWSTPRMGVGLGTLEALSIWGPRHGPAVIINAQSRRLGASRIDGLTLRPEVRVTAAHELCHLLLDREGTLAAVDILGGRMPLSVEQRARAFAAEFLLPADIAVKYWRSSAHRPTYSGVSAALSELSQNYGVSRSVARWQLDHGLNGTEQQTTFWLDQIIPERS